MHRLRYWKLAVLSLAGILALAACAGGSPADVPDPASDLAFGEVLVGTSASRTVTLTNGSAAPMTVLDVTATGAGVTAVGPALPSTLAAGASTELAVRFSPQTAGDVRGAVYVRSDLQAELLTLATYTGKGVLPSSPLSTAPAAVDFGDVDVGASGSQTVTVTNGGTKSASVTSITSSSAAVAVSGLALPASIAAGASATFQVTFRPTAPGEATGHVALRAEPSRPLAIVEFRGNGTAAAPAPALAASPAQIAFGDVPLGDSGTQAVTLTNPTSQPVTLSAVNVAGAGLSASGPTLPAVVAPGESTTLTVRFTPSALGSVSGSVTLLTAGRTEPLAAIACTGRGVAAPSIESVTVRNASVETTKVVQLVADVVATGAIDTSVTWSVESGSLGTVDAATGRYTAPASAGEYRVWATSKADPTKRGVGTVTVTAPAPAIAVTVSPTSASLTTGGTRTFTATVSGTSNGAVTWSVQEGASGGSITSAGVYTAPGTAGTYHVVARSAADTTRSASATVTVTSPAPPPPSGSVDPKSYGAVGDGVADDTAAFQAAANTRQPLLVTAPRVRYRITSGVKVYNSVTGDGSMPQIWMDSPSGDWGDSMLQIVNYTGTGLTVSGLHLNGGWNGTESAEHSSGVHIAGSRNVTVENNRIVDQRGDGVYVGGGAFSSAQSRDITVRNNEIRNPRRCTVAVISVNGLTITGNTLDKANNFVANIDIEPNLNSGSADNAWNVVIDRNRFTTPNDNAVSLYHATTWNIPSVGVGGNITISNNTGSNLAGVNINHPAVWTNVVQTNNVWR